MATDDAHLLGEVLNTDERLPRLSAIHVHETLKQTEEPRGVSTLCDHALMVKSVTRV